MTSEELKQWRQELGKDQHEMAEYIGIPYPTYRNWETGHRNQSALGDRLSRLIRKAGTFCPSILENGNDE
jgi:DNA-binding transcriptional regulator YiaG